MKFTSHFEKSKTILPIISQTYELKMGERIKFIIRTRVFTEKNVSSISQILLDNLQTDEEIGCPRDNNDCIGLVLHNFII